MGYDLILSGKALLDSGLAPCDIGIKDGIIKDIKRSITSDADERLDVGQMLILPSGIDAHVHFRSPGLAAKADFMSESVAAAYGGITTVCDMPNTKPPTTTLDGLKEKLASARGCHIDYGLFAGFEKGQQQRDLDAIARQCIALKLYMGSSTGNLLVDDDKDIGACMGRALFWKKTIWVHAEDEMVIRRSAHVAKDITGHYKARPPEAELSAIKRILAISKGASIHVAHVSTEMGLGALQGSGATCEVAPHHLLLDISKPSSAFLKVNPPLRTKSDRAALWEGLRTGRIDILASDHAPHTRADKEAEFDRCPSGMPGVEAMYPLMMRQMREGDIPLERLVDAISTRPAKILGLRDRGRIAPGLRADLAVFDVRSETKMTEDSCHYKCGWNPYAGFSAIFPKHVLFKGGFLIRNGNFEGEKGAGSLVF